MLYFNIIPSELNNIIYLKCLITDLILSTYIFNINWNTFFKHKLIHDFPNLNIDILPSYIINFNNKYIDYNKLLYSYEKIKKSNIVASEAINANLIVFHNKNIKIIAFIKLKCINDFGIYTLEYTKPVSIEISNKIFNIITKEPIEYMSIIMKNNKFYFELASDNTLTYEVNIQDVYNTLIHKYINSEY